MRPTSPNRQPVTLRLGLALGALAVLGGCSSVKLDDVPVETRNPTANEAGQGAAGANSGATGQSSVAPVDLSAKGGDDASAQGRVVYFDFDSFVVKDEYRGVLESNAKRLKAHPAQQDQVEGHTDERGGREYNLALGQKRAEAVVKALELLGVPGKQLEATSFGEERPADPGHDEAAWAKNRRAELKDR
jgi:peptidoglycan-associated lipoprotein